MSKSTFFTGQPILNQLLDLVDRSAVKSLARSGKHDRYYKHFDTHTHLVTMLYCALNKCTSSREVVSGMKACHNKLRHVGISKAPGKSTLCDANMKRSFEVFAQIYELLYKRHRHLLPDSRINIQKLFIADSTTITLFQEILKAAGIGKMNGKRKGGIKVHTLMSAAEDVPVKINFSAACASDMPFLKEINLEEGSFIVFDKGYVDYNEYERMSDQGVFFVTRQRNGASYTEISSSSITQEHKNKGILSDKIIALGNRNHAKKIKLRTRLVTFFDKEKERTF
jgi:hypothetical protein